MCSSSEQILLRMPNDRYGGRIRSSVKACCGDIIVRSSPHTHFLEQQLRSSQGGRMSCSFMLGISLALLCHLAHGKLQ